MWIHKTLGLLYIYFFLQHSIKKGTFHIHLIELEVQVTCNSQEYFDRLQSGNWCKCLIKIYSFYLSVPLTNKSRFVPYHCSMFIRLVLEDPFCTYHIYIFWSRNQFPHIIQNELMEFFMHVIIQLASSRASSTFLGST